MKNPSELRPIILKGAEDQLQKFYDRNKWGFANVLTKYISTDFVDGAYFGLALAAEILESDEANLSSIGNNVDAAIWLRDFCKKGGVGE